MFSFSFESVQPPLNFDFQKQELGVLSLFLETQIIVFFWQVCYSNLILFFLNNIVLLIMHTYSSISSEFGFITVYEAYKLLGLGVSRCHIYIPFLTPIHMIMLIYIIFSNYYRCRCICVCVVYKFVLHWSQLREWLLHMSFVSTKNHRCINKSTIIWSRNGWWYVLDIMTISYLLLL